MYPNMFVLIIVSLVFGEMFNPRGPSLRRRLWVGFVLTMGLLLMAITAHAEYTVLIIDTSQNVVVSKQYDKLRFVPWRSDGYMVMHFDHFLPVAPAPKPRTGPAKRFDVPWWVPTDTPGY